MLQTYHLSYTSHNEVMFRNPKDMDTAFNCLCSALSRTQSRCLAECFMSDHHHGCYQTPDPGSLIRLLRMSYCKYFNNRYQRDGWLGERGFFQLELKGLRHELAAISYTLKNAVHHGVSITPFAYPYCSANVYFMEALGKTSPSALLSTSEIRSALPRRAQFDANWQMGRNGAFLKETVIEKSLVENLYATPQAFMYQLFRRSGEDWVREQELDGPGMKPITLELIEASILRQTSSPEKMVAEMLRNEKARYTTQTLNDLDVCDIIDNKYVPHYGKASVYHLSVSEKNAVANELYQVYKARPRQIKRCLVF